MGIRSLDLGDLSRRQHNLALPGVQRRLRNDCLGGRRLDPRRGPPGRCRLRCCRGPRRRRRARRGSTVILLVLGLKSDHG